MCFSYRVIVYVKSEEKYRPQNTKNKQGFGKKKKLKGSKKRKNWKAMSIKAKPKTIKILKKLVISKEH